MIVRHGLRKAFHPRPGSPGRGARRLTRASDIILVMMAGLLVLVCIVRILQG
jgi:hypothetical protein